MNKQKRFYIGTMPEYQLARASIKDGFGCRISCTKSMRYCVYCVPQDTIWNRKTQNSLSLWITQMRRAWPDCSFRVERWPA